MPAATAAAAISTGSRSAPAVTPSATSVRSSRPSLRQDGDVAISTAAPLTPVLEALGESDQRDAQRGEDLTDSCLGGLACPRLIRASAVTVRPAKHCRSHLDERPSCQRAKGGGDGVLRGVQIERNREQLEATDFAL